MSAACGLSLEAPEAAGCVHGLTLLVGTGEEVRRQDDAVRGELVGEVRLQAGRSERREQTRRPPGRMRVLVRRLSDEDVLQRDDVGLHADDLGDVRDAARAVNES